MLGAFGPDLVWLVSTQNLASKRSVHNRCSGLRPDVDVLGSNGRIDLKVSTASFVLETFS